MALHEQDALFGVDAARQQQRGRLTRAAAQIGRVLAHGDGVQVHHGIQAVVIVLQLRPVAHRADVIADGERSGRLDSAEYTFLFGCHGQDLPFISTETYYITNRAY